LKFHVSIAEWLTHVLKVAVQFLCQPNLSYVANSLPLTSTFIQVAYYSGATCFVEMSPNSFMLWHMQCSKIWLNNSFV